MWRFVLEVSLLSMKLLQAMLRCVELCLALVERRSLADLCPELGDGVACAIQPGVCVLELRQRVDLSHEGPPRG